MLLWPDSAEYACDVHGGGSMATLASWSFRHTNIRGHGVGFIGFRPLRFGPALQPENNPHRIVNGRDATERTGPAAPPPRSKCCLADGLPRLRLLRPIAAAPLT